jgi:hypothetical protein
MLFDTEACALSKKASTAKAAQYAWTAIVSRIASKIQKIENTKYTPAH